MGSPANSVCDFFLKKTIYAGKGAKMVSCFPARQSELLLFFPEALCFFCLVSFFIVSFNGSGDVMLNIKV